MTMSLRRARFQPVLQLCALQVASYDHEAAFAHRPLMPFWAFHDVICLVNRLQHVHAAAAGHVQHSFQAQNIRAARCAVPQQFIQPKAQCLKIYGACKAQTDATDTGTFQVARCWCMLAALGSAAFTAGCCC